MMSKLVTTDEHNRTDTQMMSEAQAIRKISEQVNTVLFEPAESALIKGHLQCGFQQDIRGRPIQITELNKRSDADDLKCK